MAPAQTEGSDQPGAARRARLQAARLYLVVDSTPPHGTLRDLLGAAARGGVDIVQLREKDMPAEQLGPAARAARAACAELGMLFILNDDPALAREVEADG